MMKISIFIEKKSDFTGVFAHFFDKEKKMKKVKNIIARSAKILCFIFVFLKVRLSYRVNLLFPRGGCQAERRILMALINERRCFYFR